MEAGPLLQLQNVSKRFDSPESGEHLEILRNVNLDVARGSSLAITGPSGSGKSTLLNIIGTLDRPTSGDVLLAGQNLSGLSDKELAAVRNRKIGFVFQSHYLLPQCSVLENVLVPTVPNKERCNDSEVIARGKKLLQRVGLAERLNHRPGQLSGGERQRVAVVRALINGPELLLADEPTGALDTASSAELTRLLLDLNRNDGVTLIVVTHALELARQMARVYELRAGELRST
ncbi:MAG TPA: ABC transporter ATP-binding protein [Candidatus Binatia bacterium]|nr:ABC transporter ATP-binding protein [Candidatus Binatia bacterium]